MRKAREIQWRWVVQLLLTLVVVAIVPIGIGILLDRRFDTSPVVTLCMMFLGMNLGIVVIYRRLAGLYVQLAPPKSEGVPPPVGGDPC